MAAVDESSLAGGDSEDDIDWEEIDVPQQRDIEITLQARSHKGVSDSKKKTVSSHAERLVRINCHKIHTICLLANAQVRNKWINDPLLHARLLSLTPLALQNAFAMIHKSRVPDQYKRGNLFEAAVTQLVQWWSGTYFQVDFTGHIRNSTFDEVQKRVAGLSLEAVIDLVENEEDSELIRSPKSLMKHALMRSGSRDTSAQLFTALCRALGIPARLVVSLQSVPWQGGIRKARTNSRTSGKKGVHAGKGKGKDRADPESDEESEDNMEEIEIPGTPVGRDMKGKAKEGSFAGEGQRLDGGIVTVDKGKGKGNTKPVINLRKTKGKGQKLGAPPTPRMEASPDPITTPPVFWTEVFSRPDTRWLPVDPIRSIVNKRKVFDPSANSTSVMKQENRMLYVVAFEEDGYARDVTPRYAKEYAAKVAKAQRAGGRLGRREEWWERVVGTVQRPYRLLRDDVEDEELQETQLREGMPTSMTGFKDHPLYVLSRHLRRDEVIYPLTELGKFRGEPVYSRSSVFALKTAENWMRGGRKVKEGCQPMKWVKQRAATINKRREIEIALELGRGGGEGTGQDTEGGVMQGLYAENQTELYKPDPIINGKVPKNDFGNIDLYVPSMLPEGGAHVPCTTQIIYARELNTYFKPFEVKGVMKIARKLGFDYAEAVTGFEFKKRKAFPVIQGVVVAAENEPALLEAYWAAEEYAEEKARIKLQDRIIKRWSRLVQGLRLRKRLQEQYGAQPEQEGTHIVDEEKHSQVENVHNKEGGGFLLVADDVVEPYHLPKYQHVAPPSPPIPQTEPVKDDDKPMTFEEINELVLETMDDDRDEDMEEVALLPQSVQTNGLPKTMQQMAEDAARQQLVELPVEQQPSRSATTKARGARPSRATSGGNSTPSTKGKVSTRPGPKRKRFRSESPNSVSDSATEHRTSPVKRGRNSTVTPAPMGRVLRPRTSKTAAKIQEENEQEEAFRRAVAD